MKYLIKSIDTLNKWLMNISAWMLAATVGMILLEILLWNVFKETTLIADEYSAYLLAAMVFWGAGHTLQENGHIRITLFVNLLRPLPTLILNVIASCLTTILMGYLLYYLYRMIESTYRYETTSGTLSNTPIWIPQSLMWIGCAGFFLQLVAHTLKNILDLQTLFAKPKENNLSPVEGETTY